MQPIVAKKWTILLDPELNIPYPWVSAKLYEHALHSEGAAETIASLKAVDS